MKLAKALALAAGLTTAAGAALADENTFRVGMVTYLTGDWGYPGTSTARSFEIAAEMYGTVLGRKIETVIVDAQNPNNQIPEAQRLMAQGITPGKGFNLGLAFRDRVTGVFHIK